MLTLAILTAVISVIAQYIDKHLVANKGITRKDYFYYMCLSMIPFSIIMIIIEAINGQAKFELNIIPIALLIVGMYFRYNKQHAVQGSLKHLNPYEISTYMSLGVILAYIIDIIFGIKDFTYLTLLSIIITLIGVFTLADVKIKIKQLQKDLLVRIICEVGLGYVAHYILRYWSNGVYILLLNLLLTLIFSKGYTLKYNKEHKEIIKWVFLQQTFGFFYIYLGNFLSSNSVTLNQYVRPITIVLTIFIAFAMKKTDRKPKLKDFFAVVIVVLGLILLNNNL